MAIAVTNLLNLEAAVLKDFSLRLYRRLLTVFYVEERMRTFARQGKCSFVASSRGHEVTQAGIASLPKSANRVNNSPLAELCSLGSGAGRDGSSVR